jgi:NADH-quinone oxidoreductase subunit L
MYAFVLGLLAALLTAFYSWRLIILTFHGTPRAEKHRMDHVHESPWVMLVPLLVLSVGALFAGTLLKYPFVGSGWEGFWQGSIVNAPHNHIMEAVHHVPAWVPIVPTIIALTGIAMAYLFYMFVPRIPERLAAAAPALYRFLLNKWYFDELYDRVFVRPARSLAQALWRIGDVKLIDGMPNGAASLAAGAARGTVRFQTGRVANYALTMIGGLVLFATVLLLGIGR